MGFFFFTNIWARDLFETLPGFLIKATSKLDNTPLVNIFTITLNYNL